jgi:hypothetical protein
LPEEGFDEPGELGLSERNHLVHIHIVCPLVVPVQHSAFLSCKKRSNQTSFKAMLNPDDPDPGILRTPDPDTGFCQIRIYSDSKPEKEINDKIVKKFTGYLNRYKIVQKSCTVCLLAHIQRIFTFSIF